MKGRELEQLYAQLPEIECKGSCFGECTTVPCSPKEAKRMANHAGVQYPTPMRADGYCPFLNGGKCTIHASRPMLCRLYGVWERLPCKYGCTPSRVLSDAEGQAYLDKSMEIQ